MPAVIGQPAPPLALPEASGEVVDLGRYLGERVVVVYFYPRDFTFGCTAEACGFRDSYQDFTDAGAVVIGVSADDAESHQRFAAEHDLPFVLLSDTEGSARKAWGVRKTLGLMPGRVTYVIDKEGTVRHVFDSALSFKKHVDEALAVVRQLAR